MTPPSVSIVLPCYRAAAEAHRSIAELHRHFATASVDWEIIVVDDGGLDFPASPGRMGHRVRLIQFPTNRGKGAAVRAGMLAARGGVRIFTDVDLPYGVDSISSIMEYIVRRGFHAVIGDRTLPGSSYATQVSLGRRIASSAFSTFAGRMVTGSFFDTQCGLKGFRGDVADHLFPLLRLTRFTFDVELIYLCLRHKLDIKRVPVQLQRNTTSSVRLLRDSMQGVLDVCRIRYHQAVGNYQSEALTQIVTNDFIAAAAADNGFVRTSPPHQPGVAASKSTEDNRSSP
jgi:dolichyl-phosphate beta-glucosyltransferase